MLPDIIKPTIPGAPTKLSCSCTLSMNKKEAQKLRPLFNPLSRPAQVSPRKRVKWRLVKKWFNRYEKQRFVGLLVKAVAHSGHILIMEITDVKILKAGGSKKDYYYTAKPISVTPPMKPSNEKCANCLFFNLDGDDVGTCTISETIVEAQQEACNNHKPENE